jgi:hypothetical protein
MGAGAQQQVYPGVAQGEPPRGMGEGDLPSHYNPLYYFVWRIAELKVNKTQGSDRQSLPGHHGKGLQALQSRIEAVVEDDGD